MEEEQKKNKGKLFSSEYQPKTKKTFIRAVTRTDIAKYLLNLPLSELMAKNKDLEDFCKAKFGEAVPELTGEIAMEFAQLVKQIIDPNPRAYEVYKNEIYGKRKEEPETGKQINIPTFMDSAELLDSMTEEEIELYLESKRRKPENSNLPEYSDTKFVEVENIQKPKQTVIESIPAFEVEEVTR